MKKLLLILLVLFFIGCSYTIEDYHKRIYNVFGTNVIIETINIRYGKFMVIEKSTGERNFIQFGNEYIGIKGKPGIYDLKKLHE